MSRPAKSLDAYRLLLLDEQMDLFACREVRLHLVARQLLLSEAGDRTLCGTLLPAQPRWRELDTAALRDRRMCPGCLQVLRLLRRGESA